MRICIFAYSGGLDAKKSQKNYRRHHLKKNVPKCLLRICVFVFESKKSQSKHLKELTISIYIV